MLWPLLFCFNLKVSRLLKMCVGCTSSDQKAETEISQEILSSGALKEKKKRKGFRFPLFVTGFLWGNLNRAITPYQIGTFSYSELLKTGYAVVDFGKANICNQNNVYCFTSSKSEE